MGERKGTMIELKNKESNMIDSEEVLMLDEAEENSKKNVIK